MFFNSYEFIFIFLPLTFIGYSLLCRYANSRVARIWLTLLSLIFYFLLIPKYLLLLLISIGVNFLFGTAIIRAVHDFAKPDLERQILRWSSKKVILFFALLFNLGLLAYYNVNSHIFYGCMSQIWSIKSKTENSFIIR